MEIRENTPAAPASDRMRTLAEAASYLTLSPTTLYRLTSARKIPFYKVGHLKLFKQCELDAWLQSCKKEVLPVRGSGWTGQQAFGMMKPTGNGVRRLQ